MKTRGLLDPCGSKASMTGLTILLVALWRTMALELAILTGMGLRLLRPQRRIRTPRRPWVRMSPVLRLFKLGIRLQTLLPQARTLHLQLEPKMSRSYLPLPLLRYPLSRLCLTLMPLVMPRTLLLPLQVKLQLPGQQYLALPPFLPHLRFLHLWLQVRSLLLI